MASPQPIPETTLRLSRTLPAPREEIFRAWTDAKTLERWFAPSDEFVTKVPTLEVRPGGRYRVEMHRGGAVHVAVGRYIEIRPPEKPDVEVGNRSGSGTEDTILTVEFLDRGRSTEVVLTHEKFPNSAARDDHAKGWTGCLEMLARYVSERSAR
jgi:uncharacterized protein YndB with AHSA1/START domain